MSVGLAIVGLVVLVLVVLLMIISASGQHVEPEDTGPSPIYSKTVYQPLPISTPSLQKIEVETEEERRKKKRASSQQEEQRRINEKDDDDIALTPLMNSVILDHQFQTYDAHSIIRDTPVVIVDNTYIPSPSVVPLQAEYQDPVADRGCEAAATHSYDYSSSNDSYSSSSSDSSYDSSGGDFGGDCGSCDCGGAD